MKITIDVDCTPDEARRFLGLPDVAPMQQAMMDEIQRRMTENLKAMEPEQLFKTWLPIGLQGWEQLQKAFWGQAQKTAGSPSASRPSGYQYPPQRDPEQGGAGGEGGGAD